MYIYIYIYISGKRSYVTRNTCTQQPLARCPSPIVMLLYRYLDPQKAYFFLPVLKFELSAVQNGKFPTAQEPIQYVYHSAIRFSVNLKNEIGITKAEFRFLFFILIKFELRTRFLFFICQLTNS